MYMDGCVQYVGGLVCTRYGLIGARVPELSGLVCTVCG